MVRYWTPKELAQLREREQRIPTRRNVFKGRRTECFNHFMRGNRHYWTKDELLATGTNYMCDDCMAELGLGW